MRNSKVIEVNGIFLGAAVSMDGAQGWRFVSANARAEPADGTVNASYQDLTAMARQAYWASRQQAA